MPYILNRILEFDIFRHHVLSTYNHFTSEKSWWSIGFSGGSSQSVAPALVHVQQTLFVRYSLLGCHYFDFFINVT